ncbi:adenine deaminase [Sutcliffiella halmapala]|uniref:adenine deaminase n=1 Tax=Sutcliffiella halmapala TaxID=79882 RepID=UPI0009958CD4|nr:adenine deaminase [Sutcliffiella halmapala]
MKRKLENSIKAAAKKIPADLVIKNGKIIDVFNLEIIEADVAIKDGVIIGIGDYEGLETHDANGAFICPGLIDGHVHMESSMIHPYHFTNTILTHGVTTIITDPHEIANVSGTAGVQFMLDATENVTVDVFFMLPSCVPATPFEHNGATLNAKDLSPLYQQKRVLGLAEVMDFPSVRDTNNEMLQKLTDALLHQKQIDGHGAGLSQDGINIYRAAQIKTDHECVTAKEAIERTQRGMYVMMREGSVAKDIKALLPAVNERNARRFLFCTDDKHLDDLVTEGSIDHNIRLAIEEGLNPLLAIQIATLNAAECFSLHDKGAVAPGFCADLVLVDNLEKFKINNVFKNGKLVVNQGKLLDAETDRTYFDIPLELTETVFAKALSKEDLMLKVDATKACNIIEIIPNSLVTNHLKEKVDTNNGVFIPSIGNDQLKLVVAERHKERGKIGLGIVKGFQLKQGAIASTVAHDSHNIVAVGTNDEDLLVAIQTLHSVQGGLVIVSQQNVVATLPLSIGGLMSDQPLEVVLNSIHELHEALTIVGNHTNFNPFVTLSFLSLPVIPSLKLTDSGLFDVNLFQKIAIQ